MNHAIQGHPRQTGHSGVLQNTSTGGGNGKPPQYTCYEDLLNCIKRQKDMIPKDESPRLEGIQYVTKSEGQLVIAPERMKPLGQSRNDTKLWMCLVMKVKSDSVERNIS